MQHALRMTAAAAALLAATHGAQAQGLLNRLADRAVDGIGRAAAKVDKAPAKRARGTRREVTGSGEAAAATDAPASVPDPVRSSSSVKAARYIDSLRIPPDVEARKAEYNKFGEVSCNDCEGGIDLDGRPKFSYDQFSGKYNERAKRAGSWPIGHTHNWRGRASKGSLTVTREESVEGFRCRRLEYRLVRGEASASRPGLICFGLANSSSEIENWHEIY